MPQPFLVPCLTQLRAEFNQQNQGRDKKSDGWIGDVAHQQRISDHNPDSKGRVKAIDIDATGPWPRKNGLFSYFEFLRIRHHTGREDRLQYLILNERTCSWNTGWEWVPYTGDDPHIEHGHASARHDNYRGNDASAWQLGEVGVQDMTPEQMTAWAKSVAGQDALNEMWSRGLNHSGSITPSLAMQKVYTLESKVDKLTALVQQLVTPPDAPAENKG